MDGSNNPNHPANNSSINGQQPPHLYMNDTGFEDLSPQLYNQGENAQINAQQQDVVMEGEQDEEEDDEYGDDNEDLEDDAQQYMQMPPVASNTGGSLKISIPFFGGSGVSLIKTQEQPILNQFNQSMMPASKVVESMPPQIDQPAQKIKISLSLPHQHPAQHIAPQPKPQIPINFPTQDVISFKQPVPSQYPMSSQNNGQSDFPQQPLQIGQQEQIKIDEIQQQINQPPPQIASQPIKIVLGGLRLQVPPQVPPSIKQNVEQNQPQVQIPIITQEQVKVAIPEVFQTVPRTQIQDNQPTSIFPSDIQPVQPQLDLISQQFPGFSTDQVAGTQLSFPMYHQEQQQEMCIPPQLPSYYEQQNQPFDDQMMMDQQAIGGHKKKEKKEKKRKIKVKRDMREFYEATKTKVTLEIDPVEKRARGQSTFIFKIKPEEEIKALLDQLKAEDLYKKIYLQLRFHSKQLEISKVSIFRKQTKDSELMSQSSSPLEDLGFDYAHPQAEQTKFQGNKYGNISHDLFSLEQHERLDYQQEEDYQMVLVHNIQSLSFKKENLHEQLEKEVRIVVQFFINSIYDFGIHSVNYKKFDNLGAINSSDSVGTYFHTSDRYETQHLWMPLIQDSKNYPMEWSFKYIIPSQYTVVSSGQLFIKQSEQSEVNPRTLFHYKIKEQERAPASKIGFIIGQFPHIHKLTEVPKIKTAYSFFVNQGKYATFNQPNKFYEKNVKAIIDELQRLLNAQYPFQTLKLVFVPNLFLKNSRKQSIDFSGGVHILDEELLFSKNQQEARHTTYKYLASSLAFDFFGGQVYENSPEDFWLLQGIRENIGNHYKTSKFGTLLQRYHIMQTIESVYKKAKYGIERYPLDSGDIPNPQEFMLNELVYEKSELVMHMIESMIDKVYFERIIRELYHQSRPYVSARVFTKIFKQVCGFKLKQFAENWISSTSCPKLTVQYTYNKKNNSLDLKLSQESAMRDHFVFQRYIQDSIDLKDLMTKPFTLKDPLNISGDSDSLKSSLKQIEAMGKFLVDTKRVSNRWFEGEVNVMLYLTDGADISTQQQKMSLKMGENEVTINIPLSAKVKKTIQNKKKEYETMQMYEHHNQNNNRDDDDDDDGSADNKGSKGPSGGSHMIDNNQWKFGLNDLELEDYPIETKNIFEVKNLESSVLWIRVDPDMEYIRKVCVKQEHNNWLFQLLLEKDIIGQIEAIKQLYKLKTQQQFVYKILQSVSTNEVYYFKVRKIALKYLQKMLTSQFNKYMSHEKFLIKIFNQRNFDENIGFYRSNDFSKVMEYFFDKYLLKTLSKCKEVQFQIKDEVKELVSNFNKALAPQPQLPATADGGSISISLPLDAPSIRGQKAPREHLLMHSSDYIAQLLLKLLQENDNSENFYDDSSYLKTIIKALGSLDSFKYMPEIANEIHRQFKLDHIGKFSPQFAITIGSIAGFFNMRKQIYLVLKEKSRYIDAGKEDMEYYYKQIEIAEATLAIMDKELEEIMVDDKWPLEVRFFIGRNRVKHSFLYQGNDFLKALYIQMKVIDNFLAVKKIRDAVEYIKILVLFLEQKIQRLDWREALLDSDKAKAINNILWQLICVPLSFLDSSLLYQLKRLYYFLYGTNVPHFLIKSQMAAGIKPLVPETDPLWANEGMFIENGAMMMGPGGLQNLREIQAKTRSQKMTTGKTLQGGVVSLKAGLPQQHKIDEMMKSIGEIGPSGHKIDKVDIKLRIVTTQEQQKQQQSFIKILPDQTLMSEKPTWVQPQKQSSGFKITLGQLDPSKVLLPATSVFIPNLQQNSSLISIGMNKGQSVLQKQASGQGLISLKNSSYQSQQDASSNLRGKNSDLIQINSGNNQALDNEKQQQLILMQSISYGSNKEEQKVPNQNQDQNQDEKMQDEDDGSYEYDEFAEISFQVDWVQKIWDITGHLWYHEEAADFLEPITFQTFGDDAKLYNQYMSMIEYPIDLFTIKENIKAGKYDSVYLWQLDIQTMFNNCKTFNEESSEIHISAKKLEVFFHNELKHYGLVDGKIRLR